MSSSSLLPVVTTRPKWDSMFVKSLRQQGYGKMGKAHPWQISNVGPVSTIPKLESDVFATSFSLRYQLFSAFGAIAHRGRRLDGLRLPWMASLETTCALFLPVMPMVAGATALQDKESGKCTGEDFWYFWWLYLWWRARGPTCGTVEWDLEVSWYNTLVRCSENGVFNVPKEMEDIGGSRIPNWWYIRMDFWDVSPGEVVKWFP